MAIERNSIVILGLVAAFILGTLMANPVVEAVAGWQAAVADLQSQIDAISGIQVYEISSVSVIPEGEIEGPTFSIFCEDGDWLDLSFHVISVEPSIAGLPFDVFSDRTIIF